MLGLDRLRHTTPTNLAAAARTVSRTALDNARRAAEEISGAVSERRVLAHSLEVADVGDLTRLTRAECLDLLSTRSVGRLAYIARAGVPDIVPVNYRMLILRSGPGPKLQAADGGTSSRSRSTTSTRRATPGGASSSPGSPPRC